MNEKHNSEGLDLMNDQGFITAQWPLSSPPLHPKTDIISVSVGNSTIIWAHHSSYERNYVPTVVWRTPAPTGDEKDDVGLAKFHLSKVIPSKILVELFGSVDFTISSATQYRYAHKRIPLIYVYVISTNPNHAAHVVSILKDTPCIFYLVSAGDFIISPPASLAGTLTESKGNTDETFAPPKPVEMYNGIGVDRVASMAGARILYPHASHILVIDGGTALTYTTMVEKKLSSFGSASTLQLGGGICPGLQLRMRALYDFSDDLPLVEDTFLSKMVKDCIDKKQPLPLFTGISSSQDATAPEHETIREDDDTPGNKAVPEDDLLNSQLAITKSILGCVMTEIALLLCCVIRKWLSLPKRPDPTDKNNLPVVLVTGGDGEYYEKLLRRNHSNICETNAANVDLLNHGISDDDCSDHVAGDAIFTRNHFLLKQNKHLQHFGVKSILMQNTVFVTTENEQEETLRNQLLGLRLVLRHSTVDRYGTVFALNRSVDFENDSYLVYSDSDGKIFSMGMLELYDALSRYCECPEKAKSRDENLKIGYENKRKDAREAMNELRKKSKAIRNAVESRDEDLEPPVAPPPALEPLVGQKRKNTDGSKSQAKKRSGAAQKLKYIDRRIAKHFLVDDDGAQVMKLFFGTVTEYLKEHSWWHVEYDDGDNEDMSVDELLPYLKLYAENKSDDPKSNSII